MNRRLFLRGVAGAALAAPFLTSLKRPAVAAPPPAARRLVIFYTNNGCLTDRWFPTVANGPIDGSALTGTTLSSLSDLAHKLVFPRGLAMFPRGSQYNGYFDPHDQGMGSKLTCAPIDPGGSHYAMARSLDHVAAEYVNHGNTGPLVLSVGFASTDVKSVVSYSAPLTPYPPETNPVNVYGNLTGLFVGGEQTEADYRVLQGKSILDLVKEDLATFKRLRMSKDDKDKIDAWESLLRETEIPVVTAACNAESATMLGITEEAVNAARGGRGFDMGTAFVQGGDMMIKLIALTMMCDANRSIVLQWPGFVTFNFDGINHEYTHHGLSHRNGDNGVSDTPDIPGVEEMIWEIDNWYAGRYSKLVHLIESISEGDGLTMLDNSAVMWLPELADGDAHNNDNLPIVIAGSCGGYLKQGQVIQFESSSSGGGFGGFWNGGVPLNKLHTTLLNALGANDNGAPIQSFGTMDNNDAEMIKDPGELDGLKA